VKRTIRTRREYDAVYANGIRRHGHYAVLFYLPEDSQSASSDLEGSEGPRVGIVASRRVGGAVQRNRAKRVLREASRKFVDTLRPGSRMVLVARRSLVDDGVRTPEVVTELERLLAQALERAERPRTGKGEGAS